jgi:tetratricopeptide (TPR) repeat protein
MLNFGGLRSALWVAVVCSCLFTAFVPAIGQTNSNDPSGKWTWKADSAAEVDKGVEAYKNANYDEAIGHFRRAVELNPTQRFAKVYLATALAQEVIPGLDTPENLKTADEAVVTFQQVLAIDPHDVNSLKQVAGIYFNLKNFDKAKEWQKKVLEADPKDSEAAYTIGVIDWTLAHQNVLKAFSEAGIQDDGEGNIKAPADVMQRIGAENAALVDEALLYLGQAIENRPKYDDAMAYMNLVYRRKADLDWRNESARKEDLALANEWRNKAMGARHANEGARQSSPQ